MHSTAFFYILNRMEKEKGHLHPLTHVIRDVLSVLTEMGFEITQAPEIDSEFYNFDALNVPKDHPARDMQDTFWVKGASETVLRTHVSNAQVRYMENHKPPFKVAYFGKAYRNEATDATHEAVFHQFETLVVGKNITLGNLKYTIESFTKKLFGDKITIRLRPGYFPFVEPGLEVDMSCFKCKGGMGCSVCKGTGWVEGIGAGMVHPNVLRAGGLDPREWQGFAFGAGWDRITMARYDIPDARLMASGDLRLTNQF